MATDLLQLNRQTDDLLAGLNTWPDEALIYRPDAKAWCAVQVVDHLVRTEVEIQKAVRLGLAEPHRIGPRDRVGTALLQRLFRSRARVKVPKTASNILPDECPHLPHLACAWDQSRQELALMLASLTPEQLFGGVFQHPVGGWMDVDGVLDFFAVHMHHHSFQLQRLRSGCALGFSAMSD